MNQRLDRQTLTLLAGGAAALVLTMGLARFSYTPALPRMQVELGLDDFWLGLLAAINFAGYLSGALIGSRVRDRALQLSLFRAGLIMAVLCNAALPLFDSYAGWAAMRYLSGLASAGGMVVGTGLVLAQLRERGHGDLIGIHFGGVGVGVALTALALGGAPEAMGWRETWWQSALWGCVFALPAFAFVRLPKAAAANPAAAISEPISRSGLARLAGSYLLCGANFAIGTTYLIAVLQANGSGVDRSAWLLFGLAAAPSCYFWVRMARRFGDGSALTAAYALQTLGCLLPALSNDPVIALTGGILFGSTFMGIVAMTLALGGRLAADNPARLVGLLTVGYGVGQITGPILTGLAMTMSDNVGLPLLVAAATSLAAMLLLPKLPRPEPQRHREAPALTCPSCAAASCSC